MEIKKSKKLLSALIATSLVGIAATPIVLTSCSKKDASFSNYIFTTVIEKNTKVEGKYKDGKTKVEFSKFDKDNKVATLALIPEGGLDKQCEKFTITLTLPFDDDTSDEKKKLFEYEVSHSTAGLKKSGLTGDDVSFVKVSDKKVDPNNKKKVSFEVTINPVKDHIEPNKDAPNASGGTEKVPEFDASTIYSEIVFTFKNNNKDAKDDDKECKFIFKITYDKKA